MTSIYFRIELDLDGLILVFSFQIFLSTFVKMADFQGIKDSSDNFLSDITFSFYQTVYIFHDASFNFFSIYSLWFPIIRTLTYNLMKFFIFDYP